MDYEVGYGKPPKHARFKKGTSGNPRGGSRPKRLDLGEIWRRALSQKVTATIEGKTRRISKLDAAVVQVMNKAASGDPQALKMVLTIHQLVDGPGGTSGSTLEQLLAEIPRIKEDNQ